MSIFDRVDIEQLVSNEFPHSSEGKIATLAAKYERQGLSVEPLQVTEIVGSDTYKIKDGMLRYQALLRLPFSHPARLSVPVEIVG